MFDNSSPLRDEYTLGAKIIHLNWFLVVLLILLASIGFMSLYSAANGSLHPWAIQQIVRFSILLGGALLIALIDIRWWYRLSLPCYIVGLIMLLFVEVKGHVGMGAQRWIDFGVIQIQPSELMKLAVIMVLAKYFHVASPSDMKKLSFLIPPAIIVLLPVALVMIQPDLGTSLMIVMCSIVMFFIAGASIWLFIAGGSAVLATIPVAWIFLHSYQKERILTFLNPERDPFGAGYHITQSKIAIGSGGVNGKGFMNGSQSHLNFLPEKQTDFIFTLWVEEWGLLGGLFLMAINALIILYGTWIAFRCKHGFGRLLTFGLVTNYSLYVFINIAMVMGLIPIVGVPLPLVSYGGTAMMAALIGFGLMMSCSVHKNSKLPRM